MPSKTNAIRLLRQSAIVATSAKVAPVSLGSRSPNFAALNPIKVSADAAVGDSDESLDGPCALGGGPISVAASSCVLTPARRSSKARAALSRLSITSDRVGCNKTKHSDSSQLHILFRSRHANDLRREEARRMLEDQSAVL